MESPSVEDRKLVLHLLELFTRYIKDWMNAIVLGGFYLCIYSISIVISAKWLWEAYNYRTVKRNYYLDCFIILINAYSNQNNLLTVKPRNVTLNTFRAPDPVPCQVFKALQKANKVGAILICQEEYSTKKGLQ